MLKWIGAACIVLGCGVWGFCVAGRLRRQETELRQLMQAMEYMACELSCRQSPLPELLTKAADGAGGTVGQILLALARELRRQELPDAGRCMEAVLERQPPLEQTCRILSLLGASLGQFDLSGQQAALEAVRAECRRILQQHCAGLDQRVRSYRILGLCAGGALAILLL